MPISSGLCILMHVPSQFCTDDTKLVPECRMSGSGCIQNDALVAQMEGMSHEEQQHFLAAQVKERVSPAIFCMPSVLWKGLCYTVCVRCAAMPSPCSAAIPQIFIRLADLHTESNYATCCSSVMCKANHLTAKPLFAVEGVLMHRPAETLSMHGLLFAARSVAP